MAQRMRSVDAAWLQMDRPGNAADIVALFRFRSAPSFDDLRRAVEERLLPLPRFRERVRPRLGGADWEPDERFQLDAHLERLRLPGPEALGPALDRIATEPLDPGLPLWRLVAIELPGGEGALVAKLHHCLGDGFALVSILTAIADPEPGRPSLTYPAAPLPDLSRGAAKKLLGMAASLAGMVAMPGDPHTPLDRPLSGQRRLAFTRPFGHAAAREAAKARKASVNDLVLAALAGALHGHLGALGTPLEGLVLRALVPVNMRSRGKDGLGNGFGLVFVDLPVGLARADDRLEAVRATTRRLREGPEAAVTYGVLTALGVLPAAAERALIAFFAAKATLVVTNVPGPRQPVALAGRPVDDLVFWVPHPSRLGLGISILSYGGTIRVGVRSDAAVLRDPAALAARLEEEAGALGLSAGGPVS